MNEHNSSGRRSFEEWQAKLLSDPEARAEHEQEMQELMKWHESEEKKEQVRPISRRPAAVLKDARSTAHRSAATGRLASADDGKKASGAYAHQGEAEPDKSNSKSDRSDNGITEEGEA